MECDFYECADLIDDLKKLKMKHDEDLLRAERISGIVLTKPIGHGLLSIYVQNCSKHVKLVTWRLLGNCYLMSGLL